MIMQNSSMIQCKKIQNISQYAFTLIEMLIVLIIVWILLMATLYLSNEQIQKVKDKTVKEAFLAEMQSRYSRNLWSSSIQWDMYSSMDVSFTTWENKIDFWYNLMNNGSKSGSFFDKFTIEHISTNYQSATEVGNSHDNIKLTYSPYQISCKIWDDEENYNNVVMAIRVNDHKNYCFEIQQKNCRLMEMSESNCGDFLMSSLLINRQ